MKRTAKLLLFLLMIYTVSLFCTGCSDHSLRNVKPDSSFPEWLEAMNPELGQNKIYSYEEKDNCISLVINNPSFEDYLAILDRHTAFVKANPDYFPTDIRLEFSADLGGRRCNIFTNSINADEEIRSDNENTLLRYVQMDSDGFCKLESETGEPVENECLSEIEFLYLDEGIEGNLEHYRWNILKAFPSLRTIGFRNLSKDMVNSAGTVFKEIYDNFPDISLVSGFYGIGNSFEVYDCLSKDSLHIN